MRRTLNLVFIILIFFPLMSKESAMADFLTIKAILSGKEYVCRPEPEEKKERTVKDIIKDAALESGIKYRLLLAVAKKESNLKTTAVSYVGAKGVMQLMPIIIRKYNVTDPFDPEQNVRAGAKYLASLVRRFKSVELGLAAYNAGPSAVVKYKGIPPYKETKYFVRKILKDCGPL